MPPHEYSTSLYTFIKYQKALELRYQSVLMLYELASSRAQALGIGTLGTVSLQADKTVRQV